MSADISKLETESSGFHSVSSPLSCKLSKLQLGFGFWPSQGEWFGFEDVF